MSNNELEKQQQDDDLANNNFTIRLSEVYLDEITDGIKTIEKKSVLLGLMFFPIIGFMLQYSDAWDDSLKAAVDLKTLYSYSFVVLMYLVFKICPVIMSLIVIYKCWESLLVREIHTKGAIISDFSCAEQANILLKTKKMVEELDAAGKKNKGILKEKAKNLSSASRLAKITIAIIFIITISQKILFSYVF